LDEFAISIDYRMCSTFNSLLWRVLPQAIGKLGPKFVKTALIIECLNK
jgi:hypothetical protein